MNTNLIRLHNILQLVNQQFSDNWAKFSEAIEKLPQGMQMVKNGSRPVSEKLARHIEDKLDLPYGYLDKDHSAIESLQMASITLYHVKACAGGGRECYLENSNEPIGLPWKLLKKYKLKPIDVMAVEVDGLSMIPTYNPEDYIFIDKTADKQNIINFEAYLVKYDHELMIKRLERTANNLTMHSDNPDKNKYPSRNIIEGIDFDILGRVIAKLGI